MALPAAAGAGEGEHVPVDGDLVQRGTSSVPSRRNSSTPSDAEADAERAAGERQRHALGEQLAQDAPARRAERDAHR